MDRLKNKVAIITGGATGMGGSSARLFCEEGCKVAIVDLDEKKGQKLADEITASGQECKFWKLDITKEDMIKDVFAKIDKEFGQINILFNNAGITGPPVQADNCTEEDFQKVFDVDVKGMFLCVKHAIPYLRKTGDGGSIINMSSSAGLVSMDKGLLPYHMAKGAVISMTRNMAVCYASEKIRANTLIPSVTKTELTIEYGNSLPGGFEAYEAMMLESHPLGLGEPIDIAYAALYLASNESKHCTGSSMVVDGGITAN